MIVTEHEAQAFCAERLDPHAMNKLNALAQLLTAENERQNLVSTASLEMVWLRHFADSLQLIDHVPRETVRLLDLGSGAGFPGLPLAIARPQWNVVMVESRRKRVEWLRHAVQVLGLANCQVEGMRVEALPTLTVDAITARAFAPLDRLLPLAARFSTSHTQWLLPKGRSARQELASQPIHVQNMFHVEQSATDPAGGILIGKGVPSVR